MDEREYLVTLNDGTEFVIICNMGIIDKLIDLIGPENIGPDVEEL